MTEQELEFLYETLSAALEIESLVHQKGDAQKMFANNCQEYGHNHAYTMMRYRDMCQFDEDLKTCEKKIREAMELLKNKMKK